MKLVKLKCENCGAILKVEPDSIDIHCEHCQANYKLDDEAQHIKYDDMEKAGYDYEKGRLKARKEHEEEQRQQRIEAQQAEIKAIKDKKNRKWIILLWIFFFPFMLTYWILAKSPLSKKQKIIAVIAIWIVFLVIGSTSNNNGSNLSKANADFFASFVKRYNSVGDDQIKDLSVYNLKDENSGFYKDEFSDHYHRDAIARIGSISGGHILLVKCASCFEPFSVYAFTNSNESAQDVARTIIKAIDPTVLDDDINILLNSETKDGYLYGDVDLIQVDTNTVKISSGTLFSKDFSQDKHLVELRKCTVMEASDIYQTGIGKKTDNIFVDAKQTCESFYSAESNNDFYTAIDSDWKNRSKEEIDSKALNYYVDKLGW